jgi:hypothetical protein
MEIVVLKPKYLFLEVKFENGRKDLNERVGRESRDDTVQYLIGQ